MDLPPVYHTPTRHPDSCLSFSSPLFDHISTQLSRGTRDNETSTILSIGSGSGLLEQLLHNHLRKFVGSTYQVEGVEVQQAGRVVNRYLSEERWRTVLTTSSVSSRVRDGDVRVVMFVYPRQLTLVKQYIRERREGRATFDAVIWLGPQADWADFSDCFGDSGNPDALSVQSGSQAGLEEYELMAVLRLDLRPGVKDPVGEQTLS